MNEWKWAGSRWWKFDFHNHTPASNDYGKGPNQDSDKSIRPKDWLLNYMRAGIDCVAVTDHNSGTWIDPLKQALSELESEAHPDYRPLYLFPGVELSVQGGIHVLAILPLEKSTSDVDSLLGAVSYRADKGTSDGCSEKSCIQVIDEIIKAGGIAIPAHVDKESGLFTVTRGTTLEGILSHTGLFAMEVVIPTATKPSLYTSKKLAWAEVLGTDSHHPSGNPGDRFPGTHFTWVKMEEPSLEGLRLALIDGALSLKRSDQSDATDPNSHGPLVIESLAVDNAKYMGNGSPFICKLNPWLNTVIGGRGTGKSTTLEFLRVALDRNSEILASLKGEFEKYSKISSGRDDDGLLRENTVLTVIFRKDETRFRIKWSKGDSTFTIEEERNPEEWVNTEGTVAQRFPVRIYSQKQIFELAKDPQALLRVVDDAPEVNFRDWKTKWDELQSRYLTLRAQERETKAGLQEEPSIRGLLEDVRRRLTIFEKTGHSNVLKAYQLGKSQTKAIDAWEKSWEGLPEQLRETAANLPDLNIAAEPFFADLPENQELLEQVARVRASVQSLKTELLAKAAQMEEEKVNWQSRKTGLKISSVVEQSNQAYKTLLEGLSGAGIEDPTSYGELVAEKQRLEDRLAAIGKKRDVATTQELEASNCLTEIQLHREQITTLRKAFLTKILSGNQYVQIDVAPYEGKASADDHLRSLINRAGRGFERDIGELVNIIYPENAGQIEQQLKNAKNRLIGIHVNDPAATRLVQDARFAAHVQGLSPEQIDRIRCWFPDDTLKVKYRLDGTGGFTSIEQGSPGQKTAALLAFILSYGLEPLILDQPEDDLDNQLIYKLIVNQIRTIKTKRQILVVTHNANIVVNGDAENVVAMNTTSGQSKITAQGGLQSISIRDEICSIMEGGRDAFKQRYKRINAGGEL